MEEPDTLKPAPSYIHGPTWRRHQNGSFWLPEPKDTLGGAVINWLVENVNSPDGSGPFIPTLEQARFLFWWYAIEEEGTWRFPSGVLRRLKGWGKDPLAAAISLAELCGPVRFDYRDDKGLPVAKRVHAPWIQVAAVSQEQSKNTFSLFPVMIPKKLKQEYGLDVNKTIIHADNGGRLEAVTSSPASAEGARPTFVLRSEIQEWVETNQGHAMANVLGGNVTKIPGARTLSILNAHVPGLDSVAEREFQAYQAIQSGMAVDNRMLYDALEAPPDTPVSEIPPEDEDPEGFAEGVAKLRAAVELVKGDASWLRTDQIIESILDVRNDITESRRKFLNQIQAQEDSWIAPDEWDKCYQDRLTLEPGDRIALGFDGSKSSDHTALVACRIDDGALFVLGHWDPGRHNGEVPRYLVDAQVEWAHAQYRVEAFRADVKEFESYIDKWAKDYGKKYQVKASENSPVAFDMRGKTKQFALDCEKFLDSVLDRSLVHDGHTALRQHVLNAHRHPTKYDAISIRKASRDSSRKIDVAVCAVLAFGSRFEVLMKGKNKGGGVLV